MAKPSGHMVKFAANGGETPGYLVLPEGDGPFPGIIAIQEWWGLVGHIREVAERFAAEGFVVLAPDLYHGQSAEEPDEARKLAMALDRQRAIAEIAGGVAYLAGLDQVAPKKIGIVGWCMGGGLALSAAAHNGGVGAVVCFYGRPLEAADTARIHAPVLGLYGELDAGIPQSLVQDFEKQLERQSTPHEFHTYAGAQHAFFNDGRAHSYHPEASADAWQRALGWFRQYLA